MGIGEKQELKANCTTMFLLAGIGLGRRNILKYGFISAFIDDKDHDPHYEDSIYVLFKPQEIEGFSQFMVMEIAKPIFIEDYDYEGGYVVLVYKFPNEYLQEYKLFKDGKYSKFRKKYISLFPETIQFEENGATITEYSLHFHIFNKTEAIKKLWERRLGDDIFSEDMEMWSSPYLVPGKEILDIEYIKKEKNEQ